MKGLAGRLVIVIAFLGGSFVCARADPSRTFSDADVVGRSSGVGSRAAVVLRDGAVCTIDAIDPRSVQRSALSLPPLSRSFMTTTASSMECLRSAERRRAASFRGLLAPVQRPELPSALQ